MQPAITAGQIVGPANLGDTPGNAVFDHFFMPFAPSAGMVYLPDNITVIVIGIGVDARNRTNAAHGRPGP